MIKKRKNGLIILFSIIFLLCLSGYFIQTQFHIIIIPHYISFVQSEENFMQYEKAVKNSVAKLGYTVDNGPLKKGEKEISQSFEIKKNGKYCSSITVLNHSGTERFHFYYSSTYQNNQEYMSFDMKMLIAVVNSVSGNEFTQDDCEKVFQAYHDGKADKDGFSTHISNFMANWSISYWRDWPDIENLELSGLTRCAVGKPIESPRSTE